MNFYRTAATIIDDIDAKRGSIRSCLSKVEETQRKRASALVIETLKYRRSLQQIINAAGFLEKERRHVSLTLALVLVHDLLLAKGGIQAKDGPIKQAISRHKTRLQAEWVKLKVKQGARSDEDMMQLNDHQAYHPRYVRINTNRWTRDSCLDYFSKLGFVETQEPGPLSRMEYRVDPHVRNLLHFAPEVQFQDDGAYKSGKIILQDKASCFPAEILNPPPGSVVIDATSAPGNKTSHLSALMRNTGKLLAFEKDKRRFATLETMLAKAGCKNTTTQLADFLTIDPHDATYKEVTHILLDPSCSGSGIVNRLDYLVEAEADNVIQDDRLQKLASFQQQMICHAMKFPSVVKIVYSTCSIHAEENEQVVHEALKHSVGFELAARSEVLPTWSRRGQEGILGSSGHESVIRCAPEDGTNGFFVSCYVRKEAQLPVHATEKKRKLSADCDAGAISVTENDKATKKTRRRRRREPVSVSE